MAADKHQPEKKQENSIQDPLDKFYPTVAP